MITDGERSPKWVEGHKARIRLHLLPFFGKLGLSQITAGRVQDYPIHRMTKPEMWNDNKAWKAPARSTIHDEIVTLREAQIIIEEWRRHHDTKRPHSALGYRPPASEAMVSMDQRPVMQ